LYLRQINKILSSNSNKSMSDTESEHYSSSQSDGEKDEEKKTEVNFGSFFTPLGA
jgi:hypothetical protein